MQKISVRTLTAVALFVALEVVLSRFLSISTESLKIGFAFVPLVCCAMLYGPVWGAVAGGLADFIGAVLFPIGPYFPGFTLTNALIGLVFGLFLRRSTSGTAGIVAICAAVLINNLVLSLLLNTLWVSVLYGSPFLQLLPVRLMQNAVMIPIEIVVIIALRHPVASLARSKAV